MVIINNQVPVIDSYSFRRRSLCLLSHFQKRLVRESAPEGTAVRLWSLSEAYWGGKPAFQRVKEAETDFSHIITQFN